MQHRHHSRHVKEMWTRVPRSLPCLSRFPQKPPRRRVCSAIARPPWARRGCRGHPASTARLLLPPLSGIVADVDCCRCCRVSIFDRRCRLLSPRCRLLLLVSVLSLLSIIADVDAPAYLASSMPPATHMRWRPPSCSAPMPFPLMSSLVNAPLSKAILSQPCHGCTSHV
jgi:hypothetical protein